jgi:predicted nucleotidyltransferase
MRFGLDERTIERINAVFAGVPEVEAVILYGSRAKGDFRPGSDIDLAIVGGAVTHKQLLALENSLDDLMLPNSIDLSLMHEIENPALRDHVGRVGMAFYRRAPLESAA